MYKCKYFTLKELLPPSIYNDKTISDDAKWGLFDERILIAADLLREKFGVCTINSGSLDSCGFREMNDNAGAKYSQHKFGRALDLHFKNAKADDVRQWIRQYKNTLICHVPIPLTEQQIVNMGCYYYLNLDKIITAIETNISWVHIDCRNGIALMEFPIK